MARYLLTGAAGFIGARVGGLLAEQGHTVIGVDNLNDAYDPRLKDWRLTQLNPLANFTFEKLDISDREATTALWDQSGPFDAVINLGARAGVRYSTIDPWVYQDTNTTGTLNLLELCRHRGTNKFILASTSSLYGSDNPMPFTENADTSRPLSPYAASKKGAEALCFTYHHLYNIDVTVFRYFTVYGPAGRPDMVIFRLIQWIHEGRPVTIFGDGQQSRDFTYVDDIARGTILGLKPVGYEIVNLGSDYPLVLIDVLRMIEERLGKKAEIIHKPFHAADMKATWANVTKARELLGWETQVKFEDGLQACIDWYLQEREWAKDVPTGA